MSAPDLFPPAALTLRAFTTESFAPLVSAARWAELLALAEAFPASAQTVCLECRLAPDDDRVDLGFALLPDASTCRVGEGIAAVTRSEPGWQRLADFLRDWSTPGSDLTWQIPFICVALDDPGTPAPAAGALPPPCVSLCVDSNFFAKRLGLLATIAPAGAGLFELAALLYERLAGSPLDPLRKARLAALVSSDGIEAKHLSVMLARPGAPLKVDVRLRADMLEQYLDAIAWPAPTSTLTGLIRRYVDWPGHVQLNFVVAPHATRVLEVEVFAGNTETTPDHRREFLDKLIADGACTKAKANRLLSITAEPLAGTPDGLRIARNWYIKLRFLSDRLENAKAYVGIMPRPFQSPYSRHVSSLASLGSR